MSWTSSVLGFLEPKIPCYPDDPNADTRIARTPAGANTTFLCTHCHIESNDLSTIADGDAVALIPLIAFRKWQWILLMNFRLSRTFRLCIFSLFLPIRRKWKFIQILAVIEPRRQRQQRSLQQLKVILSAMNVANVFNCGICVFHLP